MTARSPRGGRRDFPATFFDGASDLDAYIARDVLANDLLHCADEGGAPCFANWVAPKAALIPGTPAQYLTSSSGADDPAEWYPITLEQVHSLPVFADSLTPYKIRVAVLGMSGLGNPCDFAVCFAGYRPGEDNSMVFNSTTSAVPVWLTPSGGTDILTITPAALSRMLTSYRTLDDTGGVRCDVPVFSLTARVWGRCTTAGKGPYEARLYGLQLAAFVG